MPPNEQLERLAETGILKREQPAREEIEGLIRTASARLHDAQNLANSPESRFDLAYNAAHALALAALRSHGYRAEKRYIVFQALPLTLGVATPTWRLLDRCHRERNATEYEGLSDVDDKLLTELVDAARELLDRLRNLTESGKNAE